MDHIDPDDFDSPEDYEAFKKSLCETCGGHGRIFDEDDDEEGRPCPDCDDGTKREDTKSE